MVGKQVKTINSHKHE